jgi:hypothetical protein
MGHDSRGLTKAVVAVSLSHVMNANWVFKWTWRIVSPFMDERTRRKVQMLNR